MEEILLYNGIKVVKIVSDNFDSNVYLVEYMDSIIVVDPGESESKKTIEWLEKNNKIPDYCLITHEHFDHNMGYNSLINRFDKVKTICSLETVKAIQNSKQNLSYYYNKPAESKLKNYLRKSPVFIRVIFTPGHSVGSVCFLIENLLFSGDTIIKKEYQVTKLPGGNKKDLEKSILEIDNLSRVVKDLIVFPGHGNIFEYE